jgi:diacylglycerol O-acyltransferase / wax synthase
MRQLTSLDAQFLALETARVPAHVGGLAVYDPSTAPGGAVTAQDMCRLVGERIHLLPPFRWKLVEVPFGLDHPYWIEDPDFDLDFHIRETAVPPPGNDRQLAELVARLTARPLDRGRPLWELYLIHGLEGGRVATMTKIHHAVVDGVSGAEILSILLDLDPEGRELPPDKVLHLGEREPSQLEMLGRGLAGLPTQPVKALGRLPQTVLNLGDIPGVQQVPGARLVGRTTRRVQQFVSGSEDGELLGRAPDAVSVPRTRFQGRISAHRRFSFGQLPLDRIKAIKNELGITVNDVVVTLVATGLRQWMLERDELPDEPLVAMVPVSVRTREQMGTFGNRVSMMVVPIPTDVADHRERLMRAHEVLGRAKTRHRALPASLLQDATQFIPPAVHARATRATMRVAATAAPPLNLVISNVPGPPVPLYSAGATLMNNFPVSVVADGVGLNITCLSYLDHVDFGIVVDREMVDDAWPLMDAMRDALTDLDATICGKRMKATKKRPEKAPA